MWIYPGVRMTSLELANLVGENHHAVKVKIRKRIGELYTAQQLRLMEDIYFHSEYQRWFIYYRLPGVAIVDLLDDFSTQVKPKVHRRLAELEQAQTSVPKPVATLAEALELIAAQQKEVEREREKMAVMEYAEELGVGVEELPSLTIMCFGRMLPGLDISKLHSCLATAGYLYRERQGKWAVRNRYLGLLFSYQLDERGCKVSSAITCLLPGQELLVSMYREGRLPMRKAFSPDPEFTLDMLYA